MFELNDQVALVTGASRGIGRRTAEVLAEAGAHVVLTSRSLADVEALAAEIRSRGLKAEAASMDVSRPESVRATLKEVLEKLERLDILVNNAGITRDNLILRMKDEEWHEVLSTNLHGVYYVTKEVVMRMIRQRYGRIINITSVVAQTGNPGQANYIASKAGLIGFTKAMARELASRKVTVNAVAPGFIETDMTAALGEKARSELEKTIPLGRVGTVDDVAFGVRFLASKESGYITGHVLNINGGMYI